MRRPGRSLHAFLLAQNAGLARTTVSKGAMTRTSRLIEHVARDEGSDAVVAVGFQHEQHWTAERERLARMGTATVAFARPAGDRDGGPGPAGEDASFVELPEGHPLTDEWFVVVLGETVSVVLSARSAERASGGDLPEATRPFHAIFSTDPKVAHDALACIAEDPALRIPDAARKALGRWAHAPGWVARKDGRRGVTDHVLGAMLRQTDELFSEDRWRTDAMASELVAVRAQERARVEGAVHDGSLQDLIAAMHDLEEAYELEDHADPGRLRDPRDALRSAIGRLRRDLVGDDGPRATGTLHERLRALADRHAPRGGFEVRIDLDPAAPGVLDDVVVATVRELLVNAAEHARATTVSVSVRRPSGSRRLRVLVVDDGIGYTDETLRAARADGHIGLSLAEGRVLEAGGTWTVTSDAGQGVRVDAELPLPGG